MTVIVYRYSSIISLKAAGVIPIAVSIGNSKRWECDYRLTTW